MANFDNIFTKKYRRWYKEGKKDFDGIKSNTGNKVDRAKERHKARQAEIKAKKQVRAEQVKTNNAQQIKTSQPTKVIQPLDFEDQSLFEPVDIKKHWKNRLYGDDDPSRPALRGYDRL